MVPRETFKIWASKSKKKVIFDRTIMLYFPAFYWTVFYFGCFRSKDLPILLYGKAQCLRKCPLFVVNTQKYSRHFGDFQDLVAKVKNFVTLAPVLAAISRPAIFEAVLKRFQWFSARQTTNDVPKQTKAKIGKYRYRIKIGRVRRSFVFYCYTHSLTQQDSIVASPP